MSKASTLEDLLTLCEVKEILTDEKIKIEILRFDPLSAEKITDMFYYVGGIIEDDTTFHRFCTDSYCLLIRLISLDNQRSCIPIFKGCSTHPTEIIKFRIND